MRCGTCKEEKPESEFYSQKVRRSTTRCKVCGRAEEFKRRRCYTLQKQCVFKLGGKCARCGFDDIRALQIDHVKGGGKQEILSFKGNFRSYYSSIMMLDEWQGRYQVLCANCNWIKRFENREGMRKDA